tara:strand:+ start:160 stop:423 length:264 start_codon:yes stop_codon:yes gene_type:complete
LVDTTITHQSILDTEAEQPKQQLYQSLLSVPESEGQDQVKMINFKPKGDKNLKNDPSLSPAKNSEDGLKRQYSAFTQKTHLISQDSN